MRGIRSPVESRLLFANMNLCYRFRGKSTHTDVEAKPAFAR